MVRALAAFALLELTGCAALPGIKSYAVAPTKGEWSFEITSRDVDECGASENASEAPIAPEVHGVVLIPQDGGFTLSFNEGEAGVCGQAGEAFDCAPAMQRVRIDDDLLVSNALITTGYVTDDATLEGQFTLDFNCEGSDCLQYEQTYGFSTPCRTAGAFVATLVAADTDVETDTD